MESVGFSESPIAGLMLLFELLHVGYAIMPPSLDLQVGLLGRSYTLFASGLIL
jgi:hypothetical protein